MPEITVGSKWQLLKDDLLEINKEYELTVIALSRTSKGIAVVTVEYDIDGEFDSFSAEYFTSYWKPNEE